MPSHNLFSNSASLGARRSPSSRSIIIVGTLIGVLIIGGSFAYYKTRSNISTDPHSLCPIDRSPTEIVAILLDPSDRFGEPQQIQVRGLLSRVRDSVLRFGLIEVYRLDTAAATVPQPTIHLCNPGTGKDLSRLYQNPELATKRWQTFADSLMRGIERQISSGQQATSPIFEAVQAIGVRTFSQPSFDNRQKRLVIVSDLLQNVPGSLSMYKGIPSFEDFKTTPYFAQVRADLNGVRVFIVYLNRPLVPTQGRAHIAFWRNYLEYQGAVVDSVYQLFGDK